MKMHRNEAMNNEPRTNRNLQLALAIEPDTQPEAIVGSPAWPQPWVDPHHRESLETVIRAAAPIPAESKSVRAPLAFRQPMTARQRGFLFALARELGWAMDDVQQEAVRRFAVASVNDFDRWQAAEMIRTLQERQPLLVAS